MAPSTENDTADAPTEDYVPPVGADGEIRTVRIGQRQVKMVDLFELDGHVHRIPAKPSAALIIRFMRQCRNPKIGADLAVENLLISLIGQEAWDALADSPEVTSEDVADVLYIVAHIAAGEVQKLRAASGN